VSGSGKSTLVDDILRRALFRHFYRSKERPGKFERILGLEQVDKVIVIDQTPIGRTPRSNPATFTGRFGPVRDLYSNLPASRVRGYDAGRFSFNVKGGRCEACEGDGVKKIEMHFLADVYVECEVCRGRRYNRETLEITYKGKNIADILDMTVDEAARFFRNVPQIYERLAALMDVGLGYVRLGQSGTTLSGGEAQRIKLAAELAKKATGRTVYILDEPTYLGSILPIFTHCSKCS
jgi:excinuclease ABC subunit A